MRIIVGIIAVLLSVGVVAVLLAALIGAFLEVKAWPREEMIVCNRHGMIRKSACIKFMGVDYCSLCFNDRYKEAMGG